jgi:hypothetical protein
VIIGGALVNQKFADDIGADGYAQDAGEAVALVKRLVKGQEGSNQRSALYSHRAGTLAESRPASM